MYISQLIWNQVRIKLSCEVCWEYNEDFELGKIYNLRLLQICITYHVHLCTIKQGVEWTLDNHDLLSSMKWKHALLWSLMVTIWVYLYSVYWSSPHIQCFMLKSVSDNIIYWNFQLPYGRLLSSLLKVLQASQRPYRSCTCTCFDLTPFSFYCCLFYLFFFLQKKNGNSSQINKHKSMVFDHRRGLGKSK